MKPTAKDRDNTVTTEAIGYARHAAYMSTEYGRMIDVAVDVFGDASPAFPWPAFAWDGFAYEPNCRTLISGVYRRHFPDAVKEQFRHHCRMRNACVDRSRALWRQAGRTHRTWLAMWQATNA